MSENDSSIRSLAIINFIFGIWLIISPYLLSYNTAQAKWEQTIAGIVVAILAAVRFFANSQIWASWVNALIGIWMIIAPFATGYQSSASHWNEVIFGILIALVGIGNGLTHSSGRTAHGGHHSMA